MPSIRKNIVVGSVLFGAVCAWAQPPNLVVILCDDMGYADVGFNGCKDIPTPNIDRIAQNGVRCTSGYTTYSVCGPSRAGLMTGRYEQRFGFERNPQYRPADPNMGLPLSEHTLADVLKPVGYASGAIGKWHLGAHPTLHPLERGFDFFYGHLGGGHRYFPEDLTIRKSADAKNETESYRTWILRNHEPSPPARYLTDAFSDEAVGFIERNHGKPFFLYLAYNAPHNPLQAPEKYLSRFPGIKDTKRRTYAAMVSAIDDGVGRVLDTLEAFGLMENTLVFFLSDNGGPETHNASDNGVLHGGKGDVWEGGFRVPFAVEWKGTLPAGKMYAHPVSSLDIMATIAELSGAPLDPKRPLDGVNLVPYLTGKKTAPPHDAIYLRKFDGGKYAVRSGDYKMIIPFAGGAPELYNLNEDIGEENNIARRYPEKLQRLEALRVQWDAQLVEPRFLGLIHTPEWQEKLRRKKKRSKSAWDWFGAMDRDRNGTLTEDEWIGWTRAEAARKGRAYDEARQKGNFAGRDTDGDGFVTRREFEEGMK